MLFTRLVKIHQPIFLRSAQSIIEKLNYKRWILGLGREGRRTPSVAYGDSCSPFCRLAGEGCFQDEPSQSRCARQLSRGGEPLAKRAGFVLIGQWQKKPAYKRKTLRPCQSLSLSGEVARRSRDGEGASGTNPLSRLRRQLSRRESPWQRGQVSSSLVKGRRSQPISGKRSAFAKASPFRERWHGEAVTERVDSRMNPLSLAALDSSPEGRALGKEGRFRPHRSTAEEVSR